MGALAVFAARWAYADPEAAPKKTPPSHARSSPRPGTVRAAASTGIDAGAAAVAPSIAPADAPASPGGGRSSGEPPSPVDAGVVEARTLDGGTRVFKFSEIDIEGRLRSPQLVYFLRRVRAEFSAGDLGHRSFLREMSETRKEPSF